MLDTPDDPAAEVHISRISTFAIGGGNGGNNGAIGLRWRVGRKSSVSNGEYMLGANPLLVTGNGGGTFLNVWTANEGQKGLVVDHNRQPLIFYGFCSEHQQDKAIRCIGARDVTFYATGGGEGTYPAHGIMNQFDDCDRMAWIMAEAHPTDDAHPEMPQGQMSVLRVTNTPNLWVGPLMRIHNERVLHTILDIRPDGQTVDLGNRNFALYRFGELCAKIVSLGVVPHMNKNSVLLLIALAIGSPRAYAAKTEAEAANSANATKCLSSASAVWRMAAAKDSSEGNASLRPFGDVRLGIELEGAEREASSQRGGDGKVAAFNGGYLLLEDAAEKADLNGSKAMTLSMRIRDTEGRWDTPLLSQNRPGDESSEILGAWRRSTSVPLAARKPIASSGRKLWSSCGARVQRVARAATGNCCPNSIKAFSASACRWISSEERNGTNIVVRFTGPCLEMFLDGVLVDEEWPHGAIVGMKSPFLLGAGYEKGRLKAGFCGQVDHVALWNRALSDDEVVSLSGGKREIARRDAEIFGPRSAERQYWRPRGYNTFVGDCMAFQHDGRFHVFFLFDRRHHQSKWGAGAHQFAHISTKDLIHWEEHPMALPITDPRECSLGTGCFVFDGGTDYLYYIQHGRRIVFDDAPYRGDNIFVATSCGRRPFYETPETGGRVGVRPGRRHQSARDSARERPSLPDGD